MHGDLIQASHQVILGGVILLDFCDSMETKLDLAPSLVIQTVQRLRAEYPLRIPRGNAGHTLTFTRVIVCADLVSARNRNLLEVGALPRMAGICTLQVAEAGGITGTLSNAMIAAGGFRPTVEGHLFKAHYQIIGGPFTTS